ncbi:MAG: hypothetical protein P4L98_13610 [Ancalomicrobiaceae bacterium]|nr:hypothetical protein [Ancalomicrobiaceae bacterium]
MFTLGIDFGTNSIRALIVRCVDGAEFGGAVADDTSGHQGGLLDTTDLFLARQAIRSTIRKGSADLARVMKRLIEIKHAQRAAA